MDVNGLDGLLFPGWVLQLDPVQGQRNAACAEAAAENQSPPSTPDSCHSHTTGWLAGMSSPGCGCSGDT